MLGRSNDQLRNATPWVLIVDDDDELRESLSEALRERDMVVREANNGLRALELIRRCMVEGLAPPAAIVLDLMMPELDGWGFAQAMDADPALRGIPLVIATAFGHLTKAQAVRFGSLPPPPVVAKPYDLATLIARLRNVCGAL